MSTNGTDTNGLAFNSAEACEAWLQTQPVTSTVQMQSVLQRQLGLLNRTELRGAERLAILETLREQIYRTQEECQSRFARRPVPLALPEQAAYEASQATWQAMIDGYVKCLESLLAGESGLSARAAHIVERIMVTLVDKQIDMYHGSQMPPARHWNALNQFMVAAESLNVLETPVKDRLRNPDNSITPLAAYAEASLLHLAAPTETSARQMAWLTRWARRWSRKLMLLPEVPPAPQAAPIFSGLDLSEPASHQPPENTGKLRVLDTTELRQSLKKRMHLLNKGESPAAVQLGDDCTMPAAGILLEKTYQRWCKNHSKPRRHERKPQEGSCVAQCGYEKALTIFPAAVDVADDVSDLARLRRERAQMQTFGQTVAFAVSPLAEAVPAIAHKFSEAETWQILDQSASGLRLIRPFARGQQRIAMGVLIALGFGEAQQEVVLATVRWVLVREDGSVEIGVQLIPGQPHAVTLSVKLPGAKTPQRGRGIMLPAVPALKESSSLLLPHGWFEPGREVELLDGKRQPIRLGQPLERGRDFDRVTFSEVSAQVAA